MIDWTTASVCFNILLGLLLLFFWWDGLRSDAELARLQELLKEQERTIELTTLEISILVADRDKLENKVVVQAQDHKLRREMYANIEPALREKIVSLEAELATLKPEN